VGVHDLDTPVEASDSDWLTCESHGDLLTLLFDRRWDVLDIANTARSTHLNTQQIDSPLGFVKPILRKMSPNRAIP
jgi:hypothetical protein